MAGALSILTIFACVLLSHLPALEAASGSLDWTYEGKLGPKTWAARYPQCSSAHQSPIDIISKEALYDKWLKPFKFSYTTKSNYEIYNGGSNIAIDFGTTDWKATFDTATEVFKPVSMHFHWGLTDNTGSEHHMDGVTYAFELHIVMYNSRDYANFSEAKKNVNGLAVVGVFFIHDDSGKPNPTLEAITKAIDTPNLLQCNCNSKVPAHTATLPFFEFSSVLPKNKRFFRYKGSLTTPPCTENVLWSLYYDRMKITTKQLKVFRKVKYPPGYANDSDIYIAGNHRPVLPLNPESPLNALRQVSASFDTINSAIAPFPSCIPILFAATFSAICRWLM